jgi:8-oxo-dGTP pyrophosphatase MutT (NUDIX family)
VSKLRSGRLEVRGTATAVPSATVLLLRTSPSGEMEVFLQERTIESDFAGGAYVFPGGKLDTRDARMPAEVLGDLDAAALRRDLGTATPDAAVALAVAAVREAFEEAGVLLAHRDGTPVGPEFLADPEVVAMRAALAARGTDTDWRPFLRAHGLVLDLAALVPFAWWITPHGLHRRYSTRFFVAAVPPGQAAALGHDGDEMTDSVWASPAAALAAGESGERVIIYPTRRTLAALAEHATVEAAIAAARAGAVDLRPIVPILRRSPDGPGVQHPDGGPIETV